VTIIATCRLLPLYIRTLITRIHDEWLGRGFFLGRGNFVELLMGSAETCIGLHIIIMGRSSAQYSILIDKLDLSFPTWFVGFIWLLSGILTLTGIVLYLFGYRTVDGYTIERGFRFAGALSSMFVWMWGGITLFPSPFMHVYFAMAIAAMRVTRLVWREAR
jgi:hypothetical protein